MDLVPIEDFKFKQPPEAPIFEPTMEEFDDPISYISKIRPVAEKYGICRIVPPAEWRPPFSVDLKKFTFNPRVQPLKELEATTRVKLMFLKDLSTFWSMQGTTLKLPLMDRRVVDLAGLYQMVMKEGGVNKVNSNSRWYQITKKLGFPPDKGNSKTMKYHYIRWVEPFVTAKSALKAAKRKKGPKKPADSTTISFSKKLCQFYNDIDMRLSWPVIDKKSVDLYSLHEAVKVSESPIDWQSIAVKLNYHHSFSADLRQCYRNVLKPFVEHLYSQEESSSSKENACVLCCGKSAKSPIITCRNCSLAYHTTCLNPPPHKVPKGEWNCYDCIMKEIDVPKEPYGFDQAEKFYTLEQFGLMAVQFKEEHFGMPCLDISLEEVEKEYWRLLTNIEHDTVVEYGADIHSVDHGMGFPTCKDDEASDTLTMNEYAKSKWNLNNIPVIETSVYSHIGTNIPGVTIPWMYIGMCFSTFCWHIEDHWSYSINYLHWGEPKTWYGIPGRDAEGFESVLKSIAPDLFRDQPDLLHDLSTTINPNTLMDRGLTVFRTDQRAGEFVVTFPRAYHAGFNQGFNFAEAVNFAPADWIPIGRACIDHYANLYHVCVFSHDELICKLAQKGTTLNPVLAKATLEDMATMLKLESKKRKQITELGVTKTERVIFEQIPDDNRQCTHCRTTCFLSAIKCSCREDLYCINDYSQIKDSCGCPPSNFIFKYRYDLDELLKLITNCKSHETRDLPK